MSANGTAKVPAPSIRPATPALALTVEQACASLSVSWDFWREHIEPEVRLVRISRRKLVPVSELQAWLDRRAEHVVINNEKENH